MSSHPLWMLVPWAVFAVAAGVKSWRLTHAFRHRAQHTSSNTEQLKASLERIWQLDVQTSPDRER